jgi:hypothetical protein
MIYICRVIASKRTQTALKGMENAPFAQSFSFVIKEKSPEDILVHVNKNILPTLTKYFIMYLFWHDLVNCLR